MYMCMISWNTNVMIFKSNSKGALKKKMLKIFKFNSEGPRKENAKNLNN